MGYSLGNLENRSAPLKEPLTGMLTQYAQIEQINRQSTESSQKTLVNALLDEVNISDAARTRLEADTALIKFSNMANRSAETLNTHKMSAFKALLNTGGIDSYLKTLDSQTLANDLLTSPIGTGIKQFIAD